MLLLKSCLGDCAECLSPTVLIHWGKGFTFDYFVR